MIISQHKKGVSLRWSRSIFYGDWHLVDSAHQLDSRARCCFIHSRPRKCDLSEQQRGGGRRDNTSSQRNQLHHVESGPHCTQVRRFRPNHTHNEGEEGFISQRYVITIVHASTIGFGRCRALIKCKLSLSHLNLANSSNNVMHRRLGEKPGRQRNLDVQD